MIIHLSFVLTKTLFNIHVLNTLKLNINVLSYTMLILTLQNSLLRIEYFYLESKVVYEEQVKEFRYYAKVRTLKKEWKEITIVGYKIGKRLKEWIKSHSFYLLFIRNYVNVLHHIFIILYRLNTTCDFLT